MRLGPETQIGSLGTKCRQPRGNITTSGLRRAVPYPQPNSFHTLSLNASHPQPKSLIPSA